jgi:hypothetical protein
MAERLPQTLENHARLHPPFHFFVLPGAAIALILAITNAVRHYELLEAWTLVVLAAVGLMAGLLSRINALKAQDRVIRLEERLRLAAILNEAQKAKIAELTESQLIAIRFASDGELSALVDKAVQNKLSNKDIKKSIVHWRADTFRV